jgi:photosystem II stability/assembly factor-like uncharacterized protein
MLGRKQIFIAILLIAFNANAQWVKTSGPQGMNVNCFYGVGNTLFAGTSSKGVFRSLNSGTSWQLSNKNIENNQVFSLIAKDGFLFAGTNDGVYRSADNGATWQPFNTNLLGKFVVSLYVANNFIYAGTVSFGLFKSDDNAQSWTDANGGALGSSTIHDVTFASPNLVAIADNLIFYSNDNGDSWFYEPTSPFLLVGTSSFLNKHDSLMLVSGRGIYRSFDKGVHWGNIINVIPASNQANISGLGNVNNLIVAGSKVGIFYSTNFGTAWKAVPATGLRNGSWFTHQFYIYGNTLLLGYDEIGLARSTDKGRNWAYSLTGFIPAASIDNALSTTGNILLCGTHGDGVYASSNGGSSWSKIGTTNNGDTLSNSNVFATLPLGNNILLAGTCGNGLYRTTNNGSTWTRIRNGLPQQNAGFLCVTSLAKGTNNVIIGTDRGLYYSTDLGLSWNASNITGTGNNIQGVAANGSVICAASESTIFNNKIYRSTNDGITWGTALETIADFTCMASDGNNHFYAGTLNSTNVLSNDNGVNWQIFGSGLIIGGYAIGVQRNNVFVGNSDGIFFSSNSGGSFSQQNSGLDPSPNNVVQGFTFTSTDVYAGLFMNSVWRRPLSDFGIATAQTVSVTNELRLQVAPNPVTSKSVITYSTSKKGNVIVNLYDVTGNLVKNIQSALQDAGEHITYIQKDKLKTGQYYVAIIVGNGHQSVPIRIE